MVAGNNHGSAQSTLITHLKSEFRVFYLDDGTIGGVTGFSVH